MAVIAPTAAGAAFTPVAAVGPDKFVNTGTERLYVENGSGGLLTVTVDSQKACDQGVDHDTTFTVAAGATKVLGAWDMARYNDGTGYVNISYSSPTSILVGVLQA